MSADRSHRFTVLVLLSSLLALPGEASGQKFVLHVRDFTSSKVCTASSPRDTPCTQFTTAALSGSVAQPLKYTIYVVAADPGCETSPAAGFSEVEFGVGYDLGPGGSVNDWVLCSTSATQVLEPGFPAAGGRVHITFSGCQTYDPGFGPQVLLGAFQVETTGPGAFWFSQGSIFGEPIGVWNCAGEFRPVFPTSVDTYESGLVWFSTPLSQSGLNPCEFAGHVTCPTPAEHPTWSRLKRLAGP